MIKPYWSILTKRLKTEKLIATGLTIPYLFGAYQILGYKINDISDLLNYILDSRAKEFPVIEKCDVIMHDVIILEDRSEANRKREKEFRIFNKESNNTLFISYNTNLGNTFDKICATLSALYRAPIDEKNFSWSKSDKIWQKFQKSEIEIIQSIK